MHKWLYFIFSITFLVTIYLIINKIGIFNYCDNQVVKSARSLSSLSWPTVMQNATQSEIEANANDCIQLITASFRGVVPSDSFAVKTGQITRAIFFKDQFVAGFANINGCDYRRSGDDFEAYHIKCIHEEVPTNCLTASILARHVKSGLELAFFANDYAIYNYIYQKECKVLINLIGMAYIVTDYLVVDHSSSTNFAVDLDNECVYQFSGKIKSFKKHNQHELSGYLMRVAINSKFDINVFVADFNLQTELILGKQVSGKIWLYGYTPYRGK